MSPLDRPVPPAGEDIHIPGPSLQPVLLAGGITTSLLGVTIFFPFLLIIGLVLTIGILVAWIRDARHEFDELPAEHHPE
jgi:Na+-transporting methylmalonyl-CoA/oxaloacetate decarboxylase gamma subunit